MFADFNILGSDAYLAAKFFNSTPASIAARAKAIRKASTNTQPAAASETAAYSLPAGPNEQTKDEFGISSWIWTVISVMFLSCPLYWRQPTLPLIPKSVPRQIKPNPPPDPNPKFPTSIYLTPKSSSLRQKSLLSIATYSNHQLLHQSAVESLLSLKRSMKQRTPLCWQHQPHSHLFSSLSLVLCNVLL